MSIEQVYKSDDKTTQRALDHITKEAVGVSFTKTAPTSKEVPSGKVVVYDNGSGTVRIYVRTSEGNVGYANLTVI